MKCLTLTFWLTEVEVRVQIRKPFGKTADQRIKNSLWDVRTQVIEARHGIGDAVDEEVE